MKKAYTKPYLAAESFQLNAAVATSCSDQGKMPLGLNVEGCTFTHIDPSITQFGGACITDVVNTVGKYGTNNTLCYHGPTIDYASIYISS